MNLSDIPIEDMAKTYSDYFSLGYLNTKLENKLALIGLICNVTFRINDKRKKENKKPIKCHDIICKIGSGNEELHNDFYKSLAVVCDDMMYGCTEFPSFGVDPKDMPKTIKTLLDTYVPF